MNPTDDSPSLSVRQGVVRKAAHAYDALVRRKAAGTVGLHMDILISLVIPTFNRANFLKQALASVAATTVAEPERIEVIVVDNNSADASPEVVAALVHSFPYKLRCIAEPNQGSSRARNRGMLDAKGKYIVFMDDDQLMECHYLANIPAAFAATGAACVGGPVTYYNAESMPRWLRELSRTIGQVDFGNEAKLLGPDTHKGLGGGNMAFIRSELLAAGGFNVRLGHIGNESFTLGDLEIQTRVRSLGKTIAYCPDLIQYHYLRPERLEKRYWRKYFYNYGRSAYIRQSVETGRERRSRFRIPFWPWRRLVTHDVPVYLASWLTFDSFKQFRSELEIWTRMGQIHEGMRANARDRQARMRRV